MALLAKHVLGEREDLGSDPQHLCAKPGVVRAWTPSAVEVEAGASLEIPWPGSLAELVSSRTIGVMEKDLTSPPSLHECTLLLSGHSSVFDPL